MNRPIPTPLALLAALTLAGLLLAGHRDEFPGRRQGGGGQSLHRVEVELWGQR